MIALTVDREQEEAFSTWTSRIASGPHPPVRAFHYRGMPAGHGCSQLAASGLSTEPPEEQPVGHAL